MIFYMHLMIFGISLTLILISFSISKKTFMDREKASPFECGFDPKSSSRLPFSLQFFLIAVIFLIFDVEITLLIPLVMTIKMANLLNYILIVMFFLSILLAGLYHEWSQGALDWAI
uniref:NADH-ubiquinone oxidoreductase chain 3 n=1 Tax=Polyphylla gracilicornis TaxID=1618307 RepID=A0A7S9H4K4_9SCAR|nr:NADH dehydrogenase subunit 3 [Polyphylla gracilicornis]QPF96301.1 NADH dehydrogenase subunit 3 [Polyphylla gracilicornis]